MKKFIQAIVTFLLPVSAFAGPASLQFIPNQGQWTEPFLYKTTVKNCDIYLEHNSITYMLGDEGNGDKVHDYKHDKSVKPILKYHAYRMTFEGSSANATTEGRDPIVTYYNYYLGNDPQKWKTGIHPFSAVTYKEVYPGIDALIKSDNGNFAYDFIVAPGANTNQIKLKFEGADKIELKEGKLLIHNSIKTVEESVPYTYQMINGEKKEVSCKYVLNGKTVSFVFSNGYDKTQPLIIDPSVVFVTFSGVTVDNYGFTATYDPQGNAYSGGEVFGPGFPVTLGAIQTAFTGTVDIGVSKYNANGTVHLFGTYIGGDDLEHAHSMVVDNGGNLIITGKSSSANFPTTIGSYQPSLNSFSQDLIVVKMNSTGTALIASTFIGGSSWDGQNGAPIAHNYGDEGRGEVICDNAGNIYVASNTYSPDFPVVNAIQPALNGNMDGVVFKLNPSLSTLLWSTYIGGSDVDGAVVLTLSNDESRVYVSGGTASNDFPTTPGAYHTTFQGGSADGYIARFQNAGTYPLLSSTYLGTPDYDQSYGVQIDLYNGVYAMGQTEGAFPIVGPVYSNPGSGNFIVKLDSTLNTLQFSTVFGNGTVLNEFSPTAFLVDSCLNIYYSGWGDGVGMPVTTNAFQSTLAGNTDFYFFATSPNAGMLLLGSYYGTVSFDHVDGGTSRFDKAGIIYQAICTNGTTFPGSGTGVYPTNPTSLWNEVTMKINFEVGVVTAVASTNSVTGCAPVTVQFQNNSQNATSYLWNFGDGSPTTTTVNPTHTFTTPGVYTIMLAANSTFACNFSDTTYVTVTVDSGGIMGDFTFQTVDSCGPYTATFTNTSTSVSPTATYTWTFGDNTSFTGPNPPMHTYPDVGSYTVTLVIHDTASACSEYDTVTYVVSFTTFDVEVTVTPQPSAEGCAPFTVQFSDGSSGANTYLWDFGDGSPTSTLPNPSNTYTAFGTYTVTLIASNTTNPSACKTSDTGYLTVIVDTGTISADFTAVVTDSCGPFTVSLTNTSPTITGTTTFTWYFGDGTSFIGQSPGTHDYPSPGTYTITLIISDPFSCNKVDSISKTITITQFLVDAVLPPIPEVCGIYDIPFSHQSSNAQSVFWSLGDGSTSIANSFTHHYDTAGEYNIMFIASNPLSCNLSDTMNGVLKIKVQAIANFSHTPELPIPNEPIVFKNLSQFADTYLWEFGDGTESQEVHPTHLFLRTDTFSVCLTANNASNCPDVVCRSVYADINPLIDLPTGFSPNGDGINDILYVRGIGVVTVNLKIFNRWGILVFETSSMDIGWDGSYKGTEQPMEAYAYVLRATFVDGREYQSQGNITLIR